MALSVRPRYRESEIIQLTYKKNIQTPDFAKNESPKLQDIVRIIYKSEDSLGMYDGQSLKSYIIFRRGICKCAVGNKRFFQVQEASIRIPE